MKNKFIYQIYPKSFNDSNNDGIGDIRGIIEKFDHIKGLGVDYIWLTPILCSPQNDNGYDISDYFSIDPIFGDLNDYKDLIELAKTNDIKIMFDLVLNHISTDHIWFEKAMNGDVKYQNYFVWVDEPNELMSAFGTPAWTYREEVGKYYLHLFDKTQVDLNWHNTDVRKALYDMINYWIEFGVEGFRLDVIDLIAKEPEKLITSRGPKFVVYLEELVTNTFQGKYLTVGECWNFGPENTLDITGPNGLVQAFHFSHLNWIYPKWGTPRISTSELANTMNKWQQFTKVTEALVLNNHDLPRLQSYWYGPSKSAIDNYLKCTMLFSLNLLSSGNTYIYQGEEVGVENAYNYTLDEYNDVESLNRIAEMRDEEKTEEEILSLMHTVSRDNARTPMKWSKTKGFGFSEAKPWLDFSESNGIVELDRKATNSIYDMYQKMIEWKKESYKNFEDFQAVSVGDVLRITNGKYKAIINLSENELDSDLDESVEIELSNYSERNTKLRAYEFIIYTHIN